MDYGRGPWFLMSELLALPSTFSTRHLQNNKLNFNEKTGEKSWGTVPLKYVEQF